MAIVALGIPDCHGGTVSPWVVLLRQVPLPQRRLIVQRGDDRAVRQAQRHLLPGIPDCESRLKIIIVPRLVNND